MNINGEIIIVEDDQDDREFLADIFESLKITNKIVFFEDPTKVVSYLSKIEVKPFMVLSDINMPKMDGYELRNLILKDDLLNKKCIPYIFLSTSKDPEIYIGHLHFLHTAILEKKKILKPIRTL